MDIDPQLLGEGANPPTKSKSRSNLRLFPPPLFSRQGVPQNYKYAIVSSPPTLWHIDFLRSYKANTASAETIVVDEETGEEKKRLINRMRWKGFGPTSVSYSNKSVCLTTEGPGLVPFTDMRWTGAGQA